MKSSEGRIEQNMSFKSFTKQDLKSTVKFLATGMGIITLCNIVLVMLLT